MLSFPDKIPKNLESDIKSISEEKANLFSHLLGIIFWVIFAPFLFINSLQIESSLQKIGIIIYLLSFLMLFVASSLYHNSYNSITRKKLRSLDHIGIYCFIVGTYTPIILIYINNQLGFKILSTLWIVTAIGSIFKIFFVGKFRLLSTIIYLAMGWTALFIISELKEVMPSNSFYWIIGGGLAYTLGTFFYISKKIKFNHLYWHIAVLLGAISHFIGIYLSI